MTTKEQYYIELKPDELLDYIEKQESRVQGMSGKVQALAKDLSTSKRRILEQQEHIDILISDRCLLLTRMHNAEIELLKRGIQIPKEAANATP